VGRTGGFYVGDSAFALCASTFAPRATADKTAGKQGVVARPRPTEPEGGLRRERQLLPPPTTICRTDPPTSEG
jgi:hypothetical protein